MGLDGFVLTLAVGAGALALWVHVRLPGAAPERLTIALLHVGAALVLGWTLVPAGVHVTRALPEPFPGPGYALLFVLPALVYIFLATIWAMAALQRLLVGARR